MYDIEVIEGHSYAIITQGSAAYVFLKAMNTKLLIKKLSAENLEDAGYLTVSEIAPMCRGFRIADLKRLQDVNLIEIERSLLYRGNIRYKFTDYGLEIMKVVKDTNEDMEIPL